MLNLDSIDPIKLLDSGRVMDSILRLPYQVDQAWKEVKELKIPKQYRLAKNVVVSGMGGSALGGRILDSLLNDRVRVPIEISTEYRLPFYVNKDTLVILSSYSGNTEETISSFYDALKKRAKIFAITSGGKMGGLLQKERIPSYIFSPYENPSNQPRMGLAYSISATLAFLFQAHFVSLSDEEIRSSIETMQKLIEDYKIEVNEDKNVCKRIARKLKGKIPIIVSSEHLYGAAHAFRNQLNENSKTFSVHFGIPEANHHLMEGLRNPAVAKQFLIFLFLESGLYSGEVKKRYSLTKEVVEKNDIEVIVYPARGKTKFEQIFEILVLGSFVSFYLAMLYQINPAPIPWVDYFKERLK